MAVWAWIEDLEWVFLTGQTVAIVFTALAAFAHGVWIWILLTDRHVALDPVGIMLPNREKIPWGEIQRLSSFELNWVRMFLTLHLKDGSSRTIKWSYLGAGWEKIAEHHSRYSHTSVSDSDQPAQDWGRAVS